MLLDMTVGIYNLIRNIDGNIGIAWVTRKSQDNLARQLVKNMPVEDAITNELRALTHHVEQNFLSFLADRDHVSYIHDQRQAPCRGANVVPLPFQFRHPG